MPGAKGSPSPSRRGSQMRTASKSPNRRSTSREKRQGTAVSMKSTKSTKSTKSNKSKTSHAGGRSLMSGKSTSSVQTRLLSAKKSNSGDDTRVKKVIMKSPDLRALNLRTEDLAFTGLTQLPSNVFTAKDIGELDISGNNLRSIPSDICKLTELRALNLSQNSIKSSSPTDYSGLPKELTRLKHLQIVAISECNLRFIPCVLFDCIGLKRLDISRNKFQMLPADIGNLVELEYLNASETSIKSLPPEIAFCEKLQEINLYGNTLDMLPETMRELHCLSELKINARSFHSHIDDYMNKLLRNGQIRSEHIPNVLFDIPEIRVLDLDGTRINNLPEENSCKLEELYLSNNYFTAIPIGLKTLPYLVMVDLSHNMLESLPSALSEYFPSLRILSLNHNSLQVIPNGICRLITLEELEFGNNKLAQLPHDIGSLTQLRVFRAPNNRISSLPESLANLLDLETLELTNNRIGELPMKLCNLTKLLSMHTYSHMKPVGLWLHKNPITEPSEVIWKGVHIKPLHNYLRKLQIKRTENLQPVKLILLGEQGSGKTSLVRTLATGRSIDKLENHEMYKKYLSNAEQSNLMKRLPRDDMIENIESPNRQQANVSSTCVAGIQRWQSENAIQFCTIDVGGAPVYRILHQFFLDPKAVYLLVYDHRKFNGKPESYHQMLGYWIDLLHLHVPGAVVKVAGTQSDNVASETFNEESKVRVMEAIKKQVDNHQANLAIALQKIKEKIAQVEEAAKSGKRMMTGNMTEFDPMANIMQLQYQQQQVENLMAKPLKIQREISVVSCSEGLPGIEELMSHIEMIAIDKELLPHCQRYVPGPWKKFKAIIKKQLGYKLDWGEVKEIGDKLKLRGEVLEDCVEYLHNCGELIWLRHQAKLQDIVFHKPLKLIEALRGIFHHNLANLMNFEENKAFSSIGKLSFEQFDQCKERMLQYGEISRQMLLSLWYYLPNRSTEEFFQYCDLVKAFELIYMVPQSEIPTSKSYKEPLMIVPWYVRMDATPEEIEEVWSSHYKEGERQLEIVYTFPQQFPEGVFERLSSKLQDQAYQRMDWANTIYMVTNYTDILIKRFMEPKTLEIHLSIQVRGQELRVALKQLTEVHKLWIGIVTAIPGLIWRVTHYAARKTGAVSDLSSSDITTTSSGTTSSSYEASAETSAS